MFIGMHEFYLGLIMKESKSYDIISIFGFYNRYPSEADKHLLSRQTGLSKNQVLITIFYTLYNIIISDAVVSLENDNSSFSNFNSFFSEHICT